jgi:hypothetical protein
VRATIYVQDPYLGNQTIEMRLPGEDFFYDAGGIPLPGPQGPHVQIVTDPSRAPLAPNPKTGRFELANGNDHLSDITAFAAANRIFHLVERYAGLAPRWGADGVLQVGVDMDATIRPELNAYYVPWEKRVHLYYAVDFSTDGSSAIVAYDGAQDSEVVAHETGHGVFDAFKPATLLTTLDPDGRNRHWTLHEGIADCCHLLDAFRQPTVRNSALEECKADLRQPNRIAILGQGFAAAMAGLPPGREPITNGIELRSALDGYVYDPSTSPMIEVHLGSEPFSEAFYELVVRLYDKERVKGHPGDAALHASDAAGAILFQGFAHYTDSGVGSLPQMAEALLAADLVRQGGAHEADIVAAFSDKNLLDADAVTRVKARLAGVPVIQRPAALADASGTTNLLGAADEFLGRNLDALGWPQDFALQAWRVETDRWGYTRVCYRRLLDAASWNALLPYLNIGLMDPVAQQSIGAGYLLFGPDGALRDFGLEVRDPAELGFGFGGLPAGVKTGVDQVR